jgi:superfamily I DNA and/or RNA helicase
MHAVIVGDHQQLQPFTTSLYARDKGLSTSMFERMMDLGK